MNRIYRIAALAGIAVLLSGGVAMAQHDDHHDNQHYDNHHYVHHNEWRKGQHIRNEDWNRGDRVDYHRYHLSAPPRGYEWREVDGNYVMAAVATGVIASVIVASTIH